MKRDNLIICVAVFVYSFLCMYLNILQYTPKSEKNIFIQRKRHFYFNLLSKIEYSQTFASFTIWVSFFIDPSLILGVFQ